MEIGPLHQARTIVERQPAQSAPAATPPGNAAVSADSVEISGDARERLAVLADQSRAEQASADQSVQTADTGLRLDKIRLARARIRSGYYNQPQTKQDIAARLAEDLTDPQSDNPETPA